MNKSKKAALTGAAVAAGLFALSVCAALLWGIGAAVSRIGGIVA